jgi:hypothetical protein
MTRAARSHEHGAQSAARSQEIAPTILCISVSVHPQTSVLAANLSLCGFRVTGAFDRHTGCRCLNFGEILPAQFDKAA